MKGAELCKECKVFETHKDSCWFFWKYKKECTQHLKSLSDIPSFKRLED